MGFAFSVGHGGAGRSRLRKTLLKHFGTAPGEIATAGRQFPITARVDIQSALQDLLRDRRGTTLLGILSPNHHPPPALADTLAGGHFPIEAGPLQYDEIDTGNPVPVRCLKNGLWLSREKHLPFAIADVLFILTTNRPAQIELALASRPGRIDQAIEFPLPDEEGRAKLAKLYSRGLDISGDVMDLIVNRTKGVSAAFIKELMRRCAQFQIELSQENVLGQAAVDASLEEMLFTSGALNRRLLGGEAVE